MDMPVSKSKPDDTQSSVETTADTDTVSIDRSGPERYRYVCPNGHTDWDRTNNHLWCRACRRQHEAGDDVTPEHWTLYDKRDDQTIHWSNVELIE